MKIQERRLGRGGKHSENDRLLPVCVLLACLLVLLMFRLLFEVEQMIIF